MLTSTSVSQQIFPIARSAPRVVLTTSATYADALAGARLAASSQAPLLLTTTDGLSPAAAQALEAMTAKGQVTTGIVFGGSRAVSADVTSAFTSRIRD